MSDDAFLARLKEFEGREVGSPEVGADPVNQAMIRHWVEAMGDTNPVYLDDEAARATCWVSSVPNTFAAEASPMLSAPELIDAFTRKFSNA